MAFFVIDEFVAFGHGQTRRLLFSGTRSPGVAHGPLPSVSRFLSRLDYFRLDLLGGVLLLVPCDPLTYFSTPQDRTRRPPRRSYGPAQGTSRATCPSSFSEYFAAGMVSILSTQGKKNPQSKKHRATQNMGIVDLLARRVSGRCAPELGPLLTVSAKFVTTLKIRTSRPLTGRRARMDSVRVTRRREREQGWTTRLMRLLVMPTVLGWCTRKKVLPTRVSWSP